MAKKSTSKASTNTICGPSPAEDRQYRARNALETITRAAELQRDSSLMRDVKKLAQGQIATLQNVAKRGK